MVYKDKIYENVDIKENVLIDLMNSSPMQRLKRVSQGGPLIFLNPKHEWNKFKTSRFEHSVGVCLLLKIFKASLEEQVAGLLHDISHTVFSHSLDFMFNRDTKHDYHEQFHEKMILDSEIPSILKKQNIDVSDILNEKRFTLLEKELPDLCADRIDYFLRDWEIYGLSKKEVDMILANLTVIKNEFMFTDKNIAKVFAEKYINANKLFWCNALQATFFKLISDLMKLGISKGIVDEDDIFTTDDNVYNKLKNSKDKEIKEMMKTVSNLEVVEDENNYEMHLKSKVRCTDPKINIDGSITKLSEVDKLYKEEMENFIKTTSKGFFVRIKRK